MSLTFTEPEEVPEAFNVLLYGPPKSGKTVAAATAPGPILWLNLQGGNALRFARKVATERGTKIHEVRVGADDPIRPVLEGVYRHVRSGAEPQVRTVVVDTIGDVRELMAKQIANGRNPKQQQWGDIAKAIVGFVLGLRDLGVNCVYIAHQKVLDSDTGDRIVEPAIGGAATAKVAAEVDVIAYCGRTVTEDGPKYVGVMVEHNGRIGGDRSNGLGASRQLDLTEWLETYREALATDGVDAPADAPFPLPEPVAS